MEIKTETKKILGNTWVKIAPFLFEGHSRPRPDPVIASLREAVVSVIDLYTRRQVPNTDLNPILKATGQLLREAIVKNPNPYGIQREALKFLTFVGEQVGFNLSGMRGPVAVMVRRLRQSYDRSMNDRKFPEALSIAEKMMLIGLKQGRRLAIAAAEKGKNGTWSSEIQRNWERALARLKELPA